MTSMGCKSGRNIVAIHSQIQILLSLLFQKIRVTTQTTVLIAILVPVALLALHKAPAAKCAHSCRHPHGSRSSSCLKTSCEMLAARHTACRRLYKQRQPTATWTLSSSPCGRFSTHSMQLSKKLFSVGRACLAAAQYTNRVIKAEEMLFSGCIVGLQMESNMGAQALPQTSLHLLNSCDRGGHCSSRLRPDVSCVVALHMWQAN